jgi:hypothetical protein
MSTIQLVLLWYGGLLVATVLLFAALGASEHGLRYFIASAVIVTALAVYTFSPRQPAAAI